MTSSARLEHDPEIEYRRRLEESRSANSRYKIQDARLSLVRFALLLLGALFGIWLVVTKSHSLYWIAIPVVLFVTCAVAHARVIRALETSSRRIAFYERGLARVHNEWVGKGRSGERFLNASHPYARDLDIFGEGSLFELLCVARTRAGEATLAKWLLEPAPPEEVVARQTAVIELRERLQLREDLAVLGEKIDVGVRPEALAEWGENQSFLGPGYLRVALPVLAVFWVASLIVWATTHSWYFAALMTVFNGFVSAQTARRTEASIERIEAAVHDLPLLAAVLSRLEGEPFSSAKLLALQTGLSKGGVLASRSIERLRRRTDSLASRRNLIVVGVDRFVFWSAQYTLAVEAWQKQFGSQVRGWLEALGEIEALCDLAGYAYEHPRDVFPEFTTESPYFDAAGLAHPLMPEQRAVKNDLVLGDALRLVMISGPNMAGKSTFVRAVGINAVLAQCGAPVRARRLRLSPLAVAASVCVLDSLQGGISRFYAEITRLKLIMDMAQGPRPVLFLLDELLSGTNSHDRRMGAEAIVRGLFKRNAIGLVTTHDLALAEIVTVLGDRAANVHFEDHLENGELHFDYRLTPGVVQTSNALELMRSIGLEV